MQSLFLSKKVAISETVLFILGICSVDSFEHRLFWLSFKIEEIIFCGSEFKCSLFIDG